MSEKLKAEERIILMFDPYSKEHLLFNHTRFPIADIEGEIDSVQRKDGSVVVTINATFILRKKKR